MYYLGKHKGSQDDTYTHSSWVWPRFTKENIPEGVTREILAEGTDEEMCILEHKLLKFEKENGNWNKYYNESLGDSRYVDQWGKNNHMYGKKLTEEQKDHKRQISLKMWQTPIEEGGMKGWKSTEEMNRRNSERMKQLYASGEWVSPNLGKKHSEETLKKMSENRKGIAPWNKGKGMSKEEYRLHRNKKRNATDETREEYNRYMRERHANMTREQKDIANKKVREYRAKKKSEAQGEGTLEAFL
jgi:hypothetical protein